MDEHLEFRQVKPGKHLSAYVDNFWMLCNHSDERKFVTGLPDGRIDLFFTSATHMPYQVILLGLATTADQATVEPGVKMFAVSFRLPAVENILGQKVAGLVNGAMSLPADYWQLGPDVLNNFEVFCGNAIQKIESLLQSAKRIDERKQKLFAALYASDGEIEVGKLAAGIFWPPRQINRYFNEYFGVSLKAYCSILRFRASLNHIAHGKLFPELNFTDQNHFIKEIKKFSGAVPGVLARNQNDRFILLSAIKDQ